MPKCKSSEINLYNCNYADLQTISGIEKIDKQFLAMIRLSEPCFVAHIENSRKNNITFNSDDLLKISQYVEPFIAKLFAIEDEVQKKTYEILALDPIINFKKIFVIKEVKKNISRIAQMATFSELHALLLQQLQLRAIDTTDIELAVAKLGLLYTAQRDDFTVEIEQLISWCCHCLVTPEAKNFVEGWVSFNLPEKFIANELITLHQYSNTQSISSAQMRWRDGFGLTDSGMTTKNVVAEIHHCIYCHKNRGDFCSKGFPVKKNKPDMGFKSNDLGNQLLGCPLEQKISEMNILKQQGLVIAPLAMIMLDNPMCPVTGHRICNDCMKSCIYQKQDPVDVPQIESRILKDVLEISWGVEIYDLFTKWNPLSITNYTMQPYNGYKVMVMGMGPAGFTLAHYLLQQGCAVLGVDGLKIEGLPENIIHHPVKDFTSITKQLDERDIAGFGGVAEYGITARWNKSLLTLIHLSLTRKKHFTLIGSARFGGTITIADAWNLGCDHLAIAVGAGLPKELHIPGSLSQGMRAANDFLMALHLTGAVRDNTLANLQVELPAVVIGGGLTGVDAATEIQAYYLKQVERVLVRYEKLLTKYSEKDLANEFIGLDTAKLMLFVSHGREVRALREHAAKNSIAPNFIPLLHKWGGVTIVYRKKMQQSPAYRNNHHELSEALREGVLYAENCSPTAVLLDKQNKVCALTVVRTMDNKSEQFEFAAKNILIATGAKPNVAYAFEHASDLQRNKFQYELFQQQQGKLVSSGNNAEHCKSDEISFFSSYKSYGKRVTVIGDTNPAFHGSVVKAVASAKKSYLDIMTVMQEHAPNKDDFITFQQHILQLAHATIINISQISSTVIKVTIKAPLATRNYKLGNFFRIQNYEKNTQGKNIFTDPISVFPCDIPDEVGVFSFYLQQYGINKLASRSWKIGMPIAVMGPSGVKAKIDDKMQHSLLFSDDSQIGPTILLAKLIKRQNYNVTVIVTSNTFTNLYALDELENIVDKMYVVTADMPLLKCSNNYHRGNVSDSFCTQQLIPFTELALITTIIAKGMAPLVRAVSEIQNKCRQHFKANPKATALVFGPMQCMLKGVCAQCLQWQVDPVTGEKTKAVYACSWQDQPLEMIAIDHLQDRYSQTNLTITKLNELWLDV